jgi:hypothetical protein
VTTKKSVKGTVAVTTSQRGESLSADDLARIAHEVLRSGAPTTAAGGLRFERTGGGTVTFGPDPADDRAVVKGVRERLKAFRQAAVDAGGRRNREFEDDGKHLALADLASLALGKIDSIQARLSAIDHYANNDTRTYVYEAIGAALDLAVNFRFWALLDNELAIVNRKESLDGASKGGKAKAERNKNKGRNDSIRAEFAQKMREGKAEPTIKAALAKKWSLSTHQIRNILSPAKKTEICRGKFPR